MAEGYYLATTKILKRAGYKHDGNFKGSHERWRHEKTRKLLQILFNLASMHTVRSILKDAGIGKKFWFS
jgi:predicted RNA binding protein YcfA (HicA-like mRNA interferase family)